MHFTGAHAHEATLSDHAPGRPHQRPPLVVLASLRWAEEGQRPQQLLTRLARHYRVFYVEEPLVTHRDAYLDVDRPAPGVQVLTPHTRVDAAGFADAQLPVLRSLLARFAQDNAIDAPLVLLHAPLALPLLDTLAPRAVIYDCMHDIPATPAAAPLLREREAQLLQRADVVLAAGPALYQALRLRHPEVHCIANAVDARHFSAALDGATIEAISARALHAALPTPRLGWCGVIDERIDLALLAHLADSRPDWQIMMAGPVAGIAASALPRRPNIHWLGPQTAAIQPHLQAHWDLCLLPLRCDVARRRAAPIEALEFLAGQKPVVATPAHDVVALHGHIVRLAATPDAFVEACRAALCERGPLRRQRLVDAMIAVHSCTWERAAERVQQLLVEHAGARVPQHLLPPTPPRVSAAGRQMR